MATEMTTARISRSLLDEASIIHHSKYGNLPEKQWLIAEALREYIELLKKKEDVVDRERKAQ